MMRTTPVCMIATAQYRRLIVRIRSYAGFRTAVNDEFRSCLRCQADAITKRSAGVEGLARGARVMTVPARRASGPGDFERVPVDLPGEFGFDAPESHRCIRW